MSLLAFRTGLGPTEFLFIVAVAVLLVWPACRICSKAGFPGQLGVLVIIPVLNLVLFYWLAFAEWPALRRQKAGG